jgi:hypothetical protein
MGFLLWMLPILMFFGEIEHGFIMDHLGTTVYRVISYVFFSFGSLNVKISFKSAQGVCLCSCAFTE